MSEKIKEIIDYLNIKGYKMVGIKQKKILLDYITNLQKENQRLKEVVENLTTMTVCGDRKQIKNTAQYKLEQAQSRIDKALEYIGSGKVRVMEYVEDFNTPIYTDWKLKAILKGDEE